MNKNDYLKFWIFGHIFFPFRKVFRDLQWFIMSFQLVSFLHRHLYWIIWDLESWMSSSTHLLRLWMEGKSFLRLLVIALCLLCLTSVKPVQVLIFLYFSLLDNNRSKFRSRTSNEVLEWGKELARDGNMN